MTPDPAPRANRSKSLFGDAEHVVVAPVLTSVSAALMHSTPEDMRLDIDLFSRSIIAGARFLRPDATWLNFDDGPGFESALGPVQDPAGSLTERTRGRETFSRLLDVYAGALSFIVATLPDMPFVVSVPGPMRLAQVAAESGDQYREIVESNVAQCYEAIRTYAEVGAAAVCVLERFPSDVRDRPETTWFGGLISSLNRLIHSLRLDSILYLKSGHHPLFISGFDCLVLDLGTIRAFSSEEAVRLRRETPAIGVAIDPGLVGWEELGRGEADVFVSRGTLRMICTEGPAPATLGTTEVRRLIEEMRLLGKEAKGR